MILLLGQLERERKQEARTKLLNLLAEEENLKSKIEEAKIELEIAEKEYNKVMLPELNLKY